MVCVFAAGCSFWLLIWFGFVGWVGVFLPRVLVMVVVIAVSVWCFWGFGVVFSCCCFRLGCLSSG